VAWLRRSCSGNVWPGMALISVPISKPGGADRRSFYVREVVVRFDGKSISWVALLGEVTLSFGEVLLPTIIL